MSEKRLVEKLSRTVVIGDGAMGTLLYQHGAFLNTCFDELNLTRPDLIEQIHSEYLDAGCDFVETNTFGANPIKLARFGLAEKCAVINSEAVKIARRAVKNTDAMVAGAVGPLGLDNPLPTPEQAEQTRSAFAAQCGGDINNFIATI